MPDIESAEPTKADMLKKNGLEKIRSTNSSRVEPSTLPHYSEAWAEDGGKEVVQIVEGKEVVPQLGLESEVASEEKHVVVPYQEKEAFLGYPQEHQLRRQEKRHCGLRKRPFYLTVGVIIVCCVILAIALALNLKKGNKKQGTEEQNPRSLTGIDFDDPFDEPGQAADPLADLFYQRQDGVLRQATMLMNGTWLGAAANVIVASDARNGTPIATTSFTVRRTNQSSVTTVRGARASSSYNRTCTDCIMQRHVFYMDIHGTLRERLFNNETRKWENGTLAQLNIRPTSQPALQVCNGNDFVGNGTSSYRDGLSVFYGSSNNTIQQVGWTYGDTNWVKEQTFVDVNGHGGVACAINSWMSYVVMQNGTNVQFWWRDSNFTKRGNSTHPVGVWQKANASIAGIFPGTSLNMRAYGPRQARNRYIIVQQNDLTIRGYNITDEAENMKLAPLQFREQSVPFISIGSGAKGLAGTKMAFSADRGNAGRNATKRTWISWLKTDPSYITQFTASTEDLNHWTETHISTTD